MTPSARAAALAAAAMRSEKVSMVCCFGFTRVSQVDLTGSIRVKGLAFFETWVLVAEFVLSYHNRDQK